jgi:hypothetical protein
MRACAAIAAFIGAFAHLPAAAQVRPTRAPAISFITIVDACSVKWPQLARDAPVLCGGVQVSSVSIRRPVPSEDTPAASTGRKRDPSVARHIIILE